MKRAEVDAQGVDIPTLQRAYERAQEMAKSGVVSTSALDDAQRAYILAVNKRDVAQGATGGAARPRSPRRRPTCRRATPPSSSWKSS